MPDNKNSRVEALSSMNRRIRVYISLPDGTSFDVLIPPGKDMATYIREYVDEWCVDNGLLPESQLGSCPCCGGRLKYELREDTYFIICDDCNYSKKAE